MKRVATLVFALVVAGNICLGQKVYLCEKFTENGEPVKPANVWTINQSGGVVSILFQNGDKIIPTDKLNILIDKYDNDTYVPFDVKAISFDADKNWTSMNYRFHSEGNYRITFTDNKNNVLAKEFCDIKLSSAKANESEMTGSVVNVNYYSGTKISFARVDQGSSEGFKGYRSFGMNGKKGTVVLVKVDCDKDLAADQLLIYIDKKVGEGKYVAHETKIIDVEPGSRSVTFKHKFFIPGSYKVLVYNNRGDKGKVFVKSEIINIIPD
ncbi:MAG: hypothetical protein ACK40G_06820 [Cytophagaceae bacterium]